jgi:molecular chaperone Hsp33
LARVVPQRVAVVQFRVAAGRPASALGGITRPETSPMTEARDSVVRALTNDGAFRVITVSAADTVRAAISAQGAAGRTAKHFAELLTGTVLVRETMAPQLRVQGILKGGAGRGSLVADSRPGGATRGLLQLPAGTSELRLGAGSVLQMMRTLPNGAIHQGIVDVADAGGLSRSLMVYMQESEQVVSVIAVGTHGDESGDYRAGGYIVQLLPEVERAVHMIMTERLHGLATIESLLARDDFNPHALLDELLFGMPFTVTGDSELRFECGCSETQVLTTLATLAAPDIAELVEGGEVLEIRCDYCHREYQVAPERLRPLLAQS